MAKLRDVILVVLAIAFIGLAIWFKTAAPCWWYTNTDSQNVPARCIGEFTNGK